MSDARPCLRRIPGFEPRAGLPEPARGAPGTVESPIEVAKRAPAAAEPACGARTVQRLSRPSTNVPAGIRTAQRVAHTAPRAGEAAPGGREFAGRAVRTLLEVLDRRRPVNQLAAICAPGLVRAIGALVAGDHTPSRALGTAVLTKVRLFPVDTRTVEVMAMYRRGPRHLALAGRIQHHPRSGWKLTALRVM